MTDLEESPEAFHPPLRDPVAVPTAHSTTPDPSDAAADGAFGGRVDHRAGHTELTDIIAHARKGYDVRGSQAKLLVGWIDMVTLRAEIAEAERDSLRHVLALLRVWVTHADVGTMEAFAAAVAAAEREAGR